MTSTTLDRSTAASPRKAPSSFSVARSSIISAAVIAVGVWLGAASGVTAGKLLAFLFLVNLLVDPVQMLVETLDLGAYVSACRQADAITYRHPDNSPLHVAVCETMQAGLARDVTIGGDLACRNQRHHLPDAVINVCFRLIHNNPLFTDP